MWLQPVGRAAGLDGRSPINDYNAILIENDFDLFPYYGDLFSVFKTIHCVASKRF